MIKIIQIFSNVDLRQGEFALGRVVGKGVHEALKVREVVLYRNRKCNKIRVLGRQGMYCESLPDGQTYDFKLRKEQLLKTIGKYFNMSFEVDDKIYGEAMKNGKST